MLDKLAAMASIDFWRRLPAQLAGLLLPNSCCLCGGKAVAIVCQACHEEHVAPRRPRCLRCANPTDGAGLCGQCLSDPPAFDATLTAVDYATPVDQLVLQLKFGGRLAVAPWCARVLRDVLLEQAQFSLPDVICPVPLGQQRLVERGFNQSLEIARPLAAMLGIALNARLAWRVKETLPQSSLAPNERAGNIRQAFTLSPEANVHGKHVGIVDDVMTSGQTAQALSAMFKRFGAARVSMIVFARTPPHT
jgi:ComF family protein